MDQPAAEYLGNLIRECLQSPSFANLTDGQKAEWTEKIRNHFYSLILMAEINKLSDEQVGELQNLDPQSPEMEEKLKSFAQGIPDLGEEIKKSLNETADYIKQHGDLPPQTKKLP